jgi:D-alanyl-lipoteichoic acid acyltransferase DltB (MBOAT superfamily)
MNFNSLEFLVFLLVVLVLYWIIPSKFRWILLLAASYYFYMSWNVWLIFLIVGTTLISYLAAIFIERTNKVGWKRFWLVAALVVCLGVLIFFKYFNFLIQSAIDFLNLFALNLDDFSLNIILPVGISFYTFQTLSYVIDVYKGKFKAERHFGYYALFVCYFPQLVAGPIERPGDLLPQLKTPHKLNMDDMSIGMRTMLVGFFRKCVVADFCGIFVNNVFGNVEGSTSLSVFIAGVLFTIEMYNDFAGYSEIAMGCARMMGVKLTKNFNKPLLSISLTEFYKRWHITLTRWFVDYVYKPLGGSRKGTPRRIVNVFIVFTLSGLWHGANWTYVLWGVSCAVIISIETLIKKPLSAFFKKLKIDTGDHLFVLVRRLVVWFVFVLLALLFRAENVAQYGQLIVKLFTGFNSGYFADTISSLDITSLNLVLLVMIICGSYIVMMYGEHDFEKSELPLKGGKEGATFYVQKISVNVYLICAIALCWLALLATGDVTSFQYFQF